MDVAENKRPKIPSELELPTPRRVRLRPGLGIAAYFRAFITGIFVIGAFGLLGFLIFQPLVLSHGMTVTGRITALTTAPGGRAATTYEAHYAYQLGNTEYLESTSAGSQIFKKFHVGDPLVLRAVRFAGWHYAEPDFLRQNDKFIYRAPMLFVLLIWGLIAFGIVANTRRKRWLVANGNATLGTVTQKSITRGKGSAYFVHYSYEAMNGDWAAAKMIVSGKAFDSVSEHQIVTVLYDPARPERSVIYECSSWIADP